MPLDWKGELTCSTCHYMHEHDDQPYHDQAVFLRRNSVGQAFCQECHQQGFMMNRTLGHSLAKSDAHYTPYGSSAAADSFGGTDASPLLDESSSACLTCHDGSIARDEGTTEMSAGAISLGAGIWRHDGDYGRNSHPLGVRYGDARRRRSGYRDAAMLPSVIRLPGGKVECVSCHNPYSTNDSLLVIDNRGSRLCLTCHLK
ncbi:MAG: cytochrome c3 family protein [Deltaproteobacteria bacterium]|nr:cytochrome c3 family protein [Candidatus Anaeroferrophillus wilburensis]MBN2888541.1 cytochrome c3 family protein [Deltaproteobacteria bacterium]